MGNYAGARYEYCIMTELVGVTMDNNQNPPWVTVIGETVENTNPVDVLNELGAMGWQVHTTTAAPFGDDKEYMLVFIILSRPV